MPNHSLTDDAAPPNPDLSSDHEKKQFPDEEVDQSGSDKHKDENEQNSFDEAQTNSLTNVHEQEQSQDKVDDEVDASDNNNNDKDKCEIEFGYENGYKDEDGTEKEKDKNNDVDADADGDGDEDKNENENGYKDEDGTKKEKDKNNDANGDGDGDGDENKNENENGYKNEDGTEKEKNNDNDVDEDKNETEKESENEGGDDNENKDIEEDEKVEDESEDEDEDEEEKEDEVEEEEDEDEEVEDEEEDEDGYITVDLSEVRDQIQCPICLGIIRKTRAVMQCLHRFCKECIDKSMRMGNNECPVCRTHCPSRRSLRDDPNFDNLISLLFPDIDKYEEEEMRLEEDEIICNKQIQASIAETRQRQALAVSRKRRSRNTGNAGDFLVSNDNENDEGSDSLSDGENMQNEPGEQEIQYLQESSTINADANQEIISSSSAFTSGVNAQQSNTRVDRESARSSRLARFINYLQNLEENEAEFEMHFILVSLDEQRIPSLQEPYLCCKPTVSVKILFKYIELKIGVQADQVELYLVEEPQASIIRGERTIDPEKDKLHVLREEQTLAELYTTPNAVTCGHMILAYKMK